MDMSPLSRAGSEDGGDQAARWAEVRTSRLSPWNPGTATPALRLTYCRESGPPAGPTETGRRRRSTGTGRGPAAGSRAPPPTPSRSAAAGPTRRRPGPSTAKGEESRFRGGLPEATAQGILRAHPRPEAPTFLLPAVSRECAGAAGPGRKRWGPAGSSAGSRSLLCPDRLCSSLTVLVWRGRGGTCLLVYNRASLTLWSWKKRWHELWADGDQVFLFHWPIPKVPYTPGLLTHLNLTFVHDFRRGVHLTFFPFRELILLQCVLLPH